MRNPEELQLAKVRKSIAKRTQESIGQNVSFNRIENTVSSTAIVGVQLLAGTKLQQQFSASIANANDALPKAATHFDCAANSGFLHDNIDTIKLLLAPVGIFLLPVALGVSTGMTLYSAGTLIKYLYSNDKADRDSEKTKELTQNFLKSFLRTGIILGLVIACWQLTVAACVAVAVYHLYRAYKECSKLNDETSNSKMGKATVAVKVLFELAQVVLSILSAVTAIEFNAIGNAQTAITSAQTNQDMSGVRDGIDSVNAHYNTVDSCALVMAYASMVSLGSAFLLSVRGIYNWMTGSDTPKLETTKSNNQSDDNAQNTDDNQHLAGDFVPAANRR